MSAPLPLGKEVWLVGSSTLTLAHLYTGHYLLPVFVAACHTRYPKVTLNLEVANTQEIVKGVLDSRFALGLNNSWIPAFAGKTGSRTSPNLCRPGEGGGPCCAC